jgi:dihydrolipoamide dehydrogenase
MTIRLVVIGAGPGGYAAAFAAADLGMAVTLVDSSSRLGGVCLQRGCIPSKALLANARLLEETEAAATRGIRFQRPEIDLAALCAWKDGVIAKIASGLEGLADKRGVTFMEGTAAFDASRRILVTGKDGTVTPVEGDRVIIASGARPASIPRLEIDSPRVMDSTAALALADLPASLLVIGGGYIGLELGSVYAALGSKVTVVEALPGLLPGADADLVAILARRLVKRFTAIRLSTTVESMAVENAGVKVGFSSGDEREATFEKVLVAVGRKPNSSGLGLKKTAVMRDAKGFIIVDPARRTADESIWAIGDVAGEPQLAHKAAAEARIAVASIAGQKAVFEPKAIPAVVFTDPEIAWCGLTETEAKKTGRAVKVARFPWAASGRAMALDRTEGVTKILADPASGRILGAAICGVHAGDLISEAALAIEMEATVEDLASTIHPHPTLSETLMEAAEVWQEKCVHLYTKRKKTEG